MLFKYGFLITCQDIWGWEPGMELETLRMTHSGFASRPLTLGCFCLSKVSRCSTELDAANYGIVINLDYQEKVREPLFIYLLPQYKTIDYYCSVATYYHLPSNARHDLKCFTLCAPSLNSHNSPKKVTAMFLISTGMD